MQSLSERKVIGGYSCVLDVSKFGYSSYRFYFRLVGGDPQQEARIFEYFSKHELTLWVVELLARWDLEIVVVVRSTAHFNNVFKQAKRELGDFFVEYNLSMSPLTHHFKRDYLIGEKRRKLVDTYFGNEPHFPLKLPEKERLLASNSIKTCGKQFTTFLIQAPSNIIRNGK